MQKKCCNKTHEQCDCCKIRIDSFDCLRNSDLNLPTLGIVPGDSGEAILRKIEEFANTLNQMTQGPEGPEGPQGQRGPKGCKGKKGDVGPQGESIAGQDGTNAFKFIKQVNTNFNGGTVQIPYSEYTACSTLPVGCLFPGTSSDKPDFHIQLWQRAASPLGNTWTPVPESAIKSLEINTTTGNITISLSGAEKSIILRVVILA